MRNRHRPRVCRHCQAPMASGAATCWRCGVAWATEEEPPTTLRLVPSGPPASDPPPAGSRHAPGGRRGDGMMVAHRWHKPQNVSRARPTATAAAAHLVADHRFSEEELAGLLSALRERAQAHPDNPGLVACWPAVPAARMAAACGLLARRGHSVRPVTVALWDRERTRDGWTLGTPPHDVAPTLDRAEIVARSDTDRWTNEGGGLDADARRPAVGDRRTTG